MKKALTIGLAGAAVAATLSFAVTGSKTESPVVSEAKATEVEPDNAPVVLAQVLNYERGPRIIIVPQTGDRASSRASVSREVYEGDNVAPPPVRTTPRWAPNLESKRPETKSYEAKPYIEPPRRVETPVKSRSEPRPPERRKVRHIDMSKPKPKAETKIETKAEPDVPIPQPPSPRRAVLSAPPLPAEGPSPIKPTPKFGTSALGAKAEATAAKPDEPVADTANDSPPPGEITADSPPPGYTPPAGMLRDEAGNRY